MELEGVVLIPTTSVLCAPTSVLCARPDALLGGC